MAEESLSDMGLYGLAVMGQNFALNVAEHGFTISVCNRSPAKVQAALLEAMAETVQQEHIFEAMLKPIHREHFFGIDVQC